MAADKQASERTSRRASEEGNYYKTSTRKLVKSLRLVESRYVAGRHSSFQDRQVVTGCVKSFQHTPVGVARRRRTSAPTKLENTT